MDNWLCCSSATIASKATACSSIRLVMSGSISIQIKLCDQTLLEVAAPKRLQEQQHKNKDIISLSEPRNFASPKSFAASWPIARRKGSCFSAWHLGIGRFAHFAHPLGKSNVACANSLDKVGGKLGVLNGGNNNHHLLEKNISCA